MSWVDLASPPPRVPSRLPEMYRYSGKTPGRLIRAGFRPLMAGSGTGTRSEGQGWPRRKRSPTASSTRDFATVALEEGRGACGGSSAHEGLKEAVAGARDRRGADQGRRLDQGARRRGLAQALEGSQEGRANAQGERGKESALRAQGRENSFWFVRQSALRQRRRRPAPGSPATTPFSPLRSSEGVPGVGLGRGLDLARRPAVSKNEAVGR